MKKYKGILFVLMIPALIMSTGCGGNNKGSGSSSATSQAHSNHEMDGYGFCKVGGEYLGTTLVQGVNNIQIEEDGGQAFFRVESKHHSIAGMEMSETSTAEISSSQVFVMENGKPLIVVDMEEALVNPNYDFVYFVLGAAKAGTIILNLVYEHVHYADDVGICVDDGMYVGETVSIGNQFIIEMYQRNGGKEFFRFQFGEGHDYALYQGIKENVYKYYILDSEHKPQEVDIKNLTTTNVYSQSFDGYIYVRATYTGTYSSKVPSCWVLIDDYYHLDDYGFDGNGNYKGESFSNAKTVYIGLWEAGNGYIYDLNEPRFASMKLDLGATYSMNNPDATFNVATYLRNKSTKEMVEVTNINETAPYTVANKDTYEDKLYFAIKLHKQPTGLTNVITVFKTEHEHVYNSDYFCTECGEFGGETITIGETVSNLKVEKDESRFFAFQVTPGKQYYKVMNLFMSSDYGFYAFVDGEKTEVSVGTSSKPTEAIECDDNTYYLKVKPTMKVENGEITIYEVAE